MQASDEPIAEVPIVLAGGVPQVGEDAHSSGPRSAAVCGYSSLSIMFLSTVSAYSCRACGSIQVLTNVARFSRALPSSIASSCTIWYAVSGDISWSGMRLRGTAISRAARTAG